jgi:hypothetical protein
MARLDGKVALITGSGTGIGRASISRPALTFTSRSCSARNCLIKRTAAGFSAKGTAGPCSNAPNAPIHD